VAALPLPACSRFPFILATALIAGGLGDALVETISDTGVFGRGYHDTNHLGVLPVLLCGVVLAVEIALLRSLRSLRRAPPGRDWLADLATRFGSRAPLRDVPYVFVLQLGVVFGIESLEQALSGGAPPAGPAWLGAPIAFSLAAHGLIALSLTVAVAAVVRALAATLTTLVRVALALVALAMRSDGETALHERRDGVPFVRRQSLHARHAGERAPPLLHAFAA
jgi:hypothetical protein